MEQTKNDFSLIELVDRPVLCVRENMITTVNRPAAQMQIKIGTAVKEILTQDWEAYETYSGGQLYLTVCVADIPSGAVVIRNGDTDYFILDQPSDDAKLQIMALAAQQLRTPLSNVMILTDKLLSNRSLEPDGEVREQAKRINKGLFQLLRIISNMADAPRYIGPEPLRKETVNFTAFIGEIFEGATTLIRDSGITLRYRGLTESVFGLAAKECLERGIYNMISNAVKFSPKGGTVEAKLTRIGNSLSLSIQDNGRGIAEDVRGNLFTRYQRSPGIEDGRYGIGLGMIMIRSAAAAHGGTVLVDQPQDCGTRVTMTIAVTQDDSLTVRTPIVQISDYAGGWNHGLLELAETLCADSYDQ